MAEKNQLPEEIKKSNYDYLQLSKAAGLRQYANTERRYDPKIPDTKSIQNLKAAIKKDIGAIRREILGVLKQQPDVGTPLDKLVAMYNAGGEERDRLTRELDAIKHSVIPKDMQTSQTGVPYAEKEALQARVYKAENQLIKEKTGIAPSGENMRLIGSKMGLYMDGKWAPGMSDSKMREMILLDDFLDTFKSIAKTALPFVSMIPGVGSVAGPVLGVANKLLGGDAVGAASEGASLIGKLLGNPTGGVNHATTKTADFTKEMVSGTTVTDRNIRIQSIKDARYRHDIVDINSLATTLAPEYFKYPAAFNDLQASAVYTGFYEIPVVPTTANGSFFFVLNTNQIFASAAMNFVTYSGSTMTYIPTTGAFTGVASIIDNPGITNTNSVAAMRLVGATVTYKPTILTNTQYASGQIDMYHDPGINTPTTSYTVSPSNFLSLTNIGYRPFYQRGPVVQEFTQVWFNPLATQDFTPTSTTTTGVTSPITLIVSGANLNGVQIGTITVNLVWNVIPTPAGLAGLPMQLPGVGPLTSQYQASSYILAPQLYMTSLENRQMAISKMYDSDGSYSSVLKIATGATQHVSHKKAHPYAPSAKQDANLSFSIDEPIDEKIEWAAAA